MGTAPGVFLDRDDTLMACRDLPAPPPPAAPGDVTDPRLVRLLPGAAEGLAALWGAGFRLVVVTNQGVVVRGGATCAQVEAVNDRLRELLRLEGVEVEGVYYCPFHPAGRVPEFTREHPWRKPGGGMIAAAARELDIDLSRSWMVGDAQRDMAAGVAGGIAPERCLRVGEEGELPDVAAAAEVILAASGAAKPVAGEVSSLILHAAEGAGLDEARTRATVLATVRALAERSSVKVHAATVVDGALHVTLGVDRLAGLGFLGEVRRATNRWRAGRGGALLWKE